MKVKIQFTGTTALMLHNERLSDSSDPITRQIKEITDKGTDQTDADKDMISKLEWRGGVYADEDGELVMPSANIIRCLREAAAFIRSGRKIARGLIPLAISTPLQIDGSRKIDDLINIEKYYDRRQVKVGKGRIKRTRPIFHKWGLAAPFELLEDQLSFQGLLNIAEAGGRAVGLCDGRILGYGRFDAKITKG